MSLDESHTVKKANGVPFIASNSKSKCNNVSNDVCDDNFAMLCKKIWKIIRGLDKRQRNSNVQLDAPFNRDMAPWGFKYGNNFKARIIGAMVNLKEENGTKVGSARALEAFRLSVSTIIESHQRITTPPLWF